MTADDTVQTLSTRAASAFSPYRDGDVQAMDELVDLLTPVLWHTARAQGASEAAWPRMPCRRPGCGSSRAVADQGPAGRHGVAHRHRAAGGLAAPEAATAATDHDLDEWLPDQLPDPRRWPCTARATESCGRTSSACRRSARRCCASSPSPTARLRRGLRGAEDAGGKHRPDPRTMPGQAARRPRQRPRLGRRCPVSTDREPRRTAARRARQQDPRHGRGGLPRRRPSARRPHRGHQVRPHGAGDARGGRRAAAARRRERPGAFRVHPDPDADLQRRDAVGHGHPVADRRRRGPGRRLGHRARLPRAGGDPQRDAQR